MRHRSTSSTVRPSHRAPSPATSTRRSSSTTAPVVSNGYRIHVDGRILAYSGDTEPTAPLDELVDGSRHCDRRGHRPGDVFSHMSWEAAAELKRHPNTRFFFNHLYSGTVTGAVDDLQVIEV